MNELTVIAVPVFDRSETQTRYTIEFVDQMQRGVVGNWLCVIVDNGSTSEHTQGFLAQLDDPRFHVIHNETNLGYGAAANQGIAYGIEHGAEYVCVINNDVEFLNPNWIEEAFLKYLRDNPTWLMGARMIEQNAWTDFDGRGYIPYLEGYLYVCHKDLWLDLNGFDPKFIAYFEDVDFCLRAKQAGYELVQSPDFEWYDAAGFKNATPAWVPIHHFGGATGYQPDFDYQSVTKDSMAYFRSKWFPITAG